MPEIVKSRLQQTEQLALEIDMDAPDFMTQLQKGMVLPEGGSLKRMFTEEDYKLLSDFVAANLGFPYSNWTC